MGSYLRIARTFATFCSTLNSRDTPYEKTIPLTNASRESSSWLQKSGDSAGLQMKRPTGMIRDFRKNPREETK